MWRVAACRGAEHHRAHCWRRFRQRLSLAHAKASAWPTRRYGRTPSPGSRTLSRPSGVTDVPTPMTPCSGRKSRTDANAPALPSTGRRSGLAGPPDALRGVSRFPGKLRHSVRDRPARLTSVRPGPTVRLKRPASRTGMPREPQCAAVAITPHPAAVSHDVTITSTPAPCSSERPGPPLPGRDRTTSRRRRMRAWSAEENGREHFCGTAYRSFAILVTSRLCRSDGSVRNPVKLHAGRQPFRIKRREHRVQAWTESPSQANGVQGAATGGRQHPHPGGCAQCLTRTLCSAQQRRVRRRTANPVHDAAMRGAVPGPGRSARSTSACTTVCRRT